MKNPEPDKLTTLEDIIQMALNSYSAAARSRKDLLDDACGAPWEPRAQEFIAQAAVLQRICDGLCKELNDLHELKEKIKKQTDKELKIIIEQVDNTGNKSQPDTNLPNELP
jgi:ATP/maltotriose-dependent transcriptional regulator MalT